METLLQTFCSLTHLTQEELRGRGREAEIAWARQVLHWLLLKLTHCTLERIGRFMHRDHSSILHSRQTVESNLLNYPEMALEVHALHQRLLEKMAQAQSPP